eukprot:1745126-Rhodomonas_salina.1
MVARFQKARHSQVLSPFQDPDAPCDKDSLSDKGNVIKASDSEHPQPCPHLHNQSGSEHYAFSSGTN